MSEKTDTSFKGTRRDRTGRPIRCFFRRSQSRNPEKHQENGVSTIRKPQEKRWLRGNPRIRKALAGIIKLTAASGRREMKTYKRGDLSPCGTLRFYQYQSYISKKTGRRAERWIPADKFMEYRKEQGLRNELSSARSEFIQMQRAKNK